MITIEELETQNYEYKKGLSTLKALLERQKSNYFI